MDKRDRQVADIFGLSYRLYRELKENSYRWRVLAPASLQVIENAVDGHWSVEKTAEWLDGQPQEAAQCLRRYRMSEALESGANAAERITKAIASWLSQFEDLSKPQREALTQDLALTLGNQLDWAAQQGHTLAQVAEQLEPKDSFDSAKDPFTRDAEVKAKPKEEEPRRWGPMWKD